MFLDAKYLMLGVRGHFCRPGRKHWRPHSQYAAEEPVWEPVGLLSAVKTAGEEDAGLMCEHEEGEGTS